MFCSKDCVNKSRTKLPPVKFCKVCKVGLRGSKRRNKAYCSKECARSCEDLRDKLSYNNKGKKQPSSVINKRLQNTDQKLKEAKRKETMLKRYNVTNWGELEESKDRARNRWKGNPLPRTEEHQKKIIESKRTNGTLKHKESTKAKIREGVKATINSPDFDKSVFITKGHRGSVTGYLNGVYYRSSYERLFLGFCEDNNLRVESAENNTFCVDYSYLGSSKRYYPDFYLRDLDKVIEIKPKGMLCIGQNPYKIDSAKRFYGNKYLVITEDHLFDSDKLRTLLSIT